MAVDSAVVDAAVVVVGGVAPGAAIVVLSACFCFCFCCCRCFSAVIVLLLMLLQLLRQLTLIILVKIFFISLSWLSLLSKLLLSHRRSCRPCFSVAVIPAVVWAVAAAAAVAGGGGGSCAIVAWTSI